MRAIDTNVLVRLIARDDPEQTESAEEFVSKGAWISQLVLAETIWILDSAYERGRGEIATAIEMLLNRAQLSVQDADVVAAALAVFRSRSAVSFSNALIVESARRSGHLPVATFDRDVAKLDGVQGF
ncbi:MAG TPA: PIN domain-containing protein [Rhizomicrobium sp.]|jgi:predicted nucleic-acid-binding protein|nr:PIN domain-containing protein [Rhizomicrobium sp.]